MSMRRRNSTHNRSMDRDPHLIDDIEQTLSGLLMNLRYLTEDLTEVRNAVQKRSPLERGKMRQLLVLLDDLTNQTESEGNLSGGAANLLLAFLRENAYPPGYWG